jgi:uncharacterized heparinase superfamily protein
MPIQGMDGLSRRLRLVVGEVARRATAPLRRFARGLRASFEPSADRLAIAPQDLRTADPTVAGDIYAGSFVFSGQVVECRGRSPFDMPPPSDEWARVLHGFGWLRHLRAADTPIARSNARALVDDWLGLDTHPPVAWEPDVASRRLMSWLAQSPMVLEDSDAAFYQRFLVGITRHVKRLRIRYGEEPDGLPRLKTAIALLAAAVAVEGFRRQVKTAMRRLDDELKRQILPDGGHISRNPAAALDILIDLLPLRQALSARGIPASAALMNAVDRMMPWLRFVRHGDGAIALFNGVGPTPTDLVATVLVYDDARGATHGNASHSGFQRLEAGRTVVIVDTGPPPPIPVAQAAHAGTLSFEFSSGTTRYVTNCGTPFRPLPQWRRMARTTAAHSTVVVGDRSSATVRDKGLVARLFGPVLVGGPESVPVERQEADGTVAVVASHDGYAKAFGVLHERTLRLSAEGDRIDGRDRVVPLEGGNRPPFVIRFHIHPQVKASALGGGGVVLLGPDGEAWEFRCADLPAHLEESVYLADLHGVRHAEQIVVAADAGGLGEVRWSFHRTAEPRALRRRVSL